MFSTQAQYASLTLSLLWEPEDCLPPFTFKLLRCLNANYTQFTEVANSFDASFPLYNSRFLYFGGHCKHIAPILCSFLWNLQTLIIEGGSDYPINGLDVIWKMPHLRHVKVHNLTFEHPRDDHVLKNLQSLHRVYGFVCSEEVVTRIPNIRKLGLYYDWGSSVNCYQLSNLKRLTKLEHLKFRARGRQQSDLLHKFFSFPSSLKKIVFNWFCLLVGRRIHDVRFTTSSRSAQTAWYLRNRMEIS